ncbi:MAG: hypothetical protein CBB68_09545 [Rhodospirillaceae bacterium TMED8]|nr:hypothetical protein [Magnetovibrio sp.]OUT50104.1 MAG: hypothetical protein CBB68_09545 [Rhodospirillaceae bacterium TMED8]|tara:strand:+ start:831 stop:2624 length:1794 start_codon:yes stop_codon:yes gene_type:complete
MSEIDDNSQKIGIYSALEIAEVIQKALATGSAAAQEGDLENAENVFQSVLEIDGQNSEALNGLGVVCFAKGNLKAAEDNLRRAIENNDQNGQYHRNLGLLYLTRNRTKRAIRSLQEAVRLAPDDQDSRYKLAWVHHGRGDQGKFVEELRNLVKISPDNGQANNDLGCYLAEKGEKEEAKEYLAAAIEADPDNADFSTNYANTLLISGKVERARDIFQTAFKKSPDHIEAVKGLATTERLLGNLDKAQNAVERALNIDSKDPTVENLAGTIFKELGSYEEAIAHFNAATELVEDFAPSISNAGMIKLLHGDWKSGFRDYEARRFDPHVISGREAAVIEQWDGSPLKNKSILLQSEQGFGDNIQFARFVRQICDSAERVVLEVRPELQKLFQSLQCSAEIINPGENVENVDFCAPLLSLPYLMELVEENEISGASYLATTGHGPEISIFESSDNLRVGVSWRGASAHKEDWKRSIDPNVMLAALKIDGISLYSLDFGGDAPPSDCVDLRSFVSDFNDTAHIITKMDLVVSVDTSTVHLAGALGQPCWALIPFVPDWRWMLERADTPWYDTVQLYRQPAQSDWDSVLKAIRTDLADWVAG